ncbi:heterokaryon incompatibility protein-domain-containing protein [Lenzites betulinus]|nr:heterokaryon incompatibility protein-domain-containing protein [Lenzites betulinus]
MGSALSQVSRSLPSRDTNKLNLPPRPPSVCQPCWEGPFAAHLGLFSPPLHYRGRGGYSYTTSLAALEARAAEGCSWCSLLLSLRTSMLDVDLEYSGRRTEQFKVAMGCADPQDNRGIYTPAHAQQFQVKLDRTCVLDGHVHAAKDDPAAAWIVARSPLGDVGSSRSLALAKKALDDCVHGHPRCMFVSRSSNTRLPTRLIDCTEPDHPHLRATDGEDGRYVALSYVWGEPDRTYQTTSANVAAYIDRIDPSKLPLTIRDAIQVTTALGIPFLWVDALCIIQDSPEDKLHEIGRMHNIYRYAHLTVIAASAHKVSDGFLQPRLPAQLSFPFLCHPLSRASAPQNAGHAHAKSHRVGEIHISPKYMVNVGRDFGHGQVSEPTNARGWCMQENLLSARVLVFATHTLRFACHSAVRATGDSLCRPAEYDARLPSALLRALFSLPPSPLPPSPISPSPPPSPLSPSPPHPPQDWAPILDAWLGIVQRYTRCALTFPSDKLVAISAVAALFHTVLRTAYVAGLWRSTLPFDMLWLRRTAHTPPRPRPRPAEYRAPSWSWAAVDDPVFFSCHFQYNAVSGYDAQEAPLVDVVRCAVTHKDPRELRFGEVLDAVLGLRAALVPCRLDPGLAYVGIPWHGQRGRAVVSGVEAEGLPKGSVDECRIPVVSPTLSLGSHIVVLDCPNEAGLDADIWLVPLVRFAARSVEGIIVTWAADSLLHQSQSRHRRVGYFRISFDWVQALGWDVDNLDKVDIELV